MHPVLVEIFTRPVGWLVFGGTLIMAGVGLTVFLFVRKQVQAEERGQR